MARKSTLTLCARVSEQTDALRSELQQRLDIPLHDLIERGLQALKSELDGDTLGSRGHRREQSLA